MDSGRLIFDSRSSQPSRMLFHGVVGDPIFSGARSILGFGDGSNKRRPFFTTAEELMEEEYYDEQVTEKKRRLSAEQVHLLERSFEAEKKLEPETKSELAKNLGLQPRQVAVWFQNRRARWKAKQLESDFNRLKSSYDALVANRDSLLKDNDRLRSQVVSLTGRLREEGQLLGAKEGEEMQEFLSPPTIPAPVLHLHRGEDRLSTGSSVIDGEAAAPAPVDSTGDSYFQESLIELGVGAGCCVGEVHGLILGPEEDGGISDDSCSYLPGGIFEEVSHENNWWVWS